MDDVQQNINEPISQNNHECNQKDLIQNNNNNTNSFNHDQEITLKTYSLNPINTIMK